MNYQQALGYIFSQPHTAGKKGLDRMRRLLALLENPQDKLKFVHIAGTNGKGSTTVMIASILKAAGYRVGSFVSPFVLEFRERIQLNGEMIPQEDLACLVEEIAPVIARMTEEGDPPMQFEVVTALGMLYFAREHCDVVCLEVGIGGRLDCTNVIDVPLAAVICSIGLDHVGMLGDTVTKIAREKAGIIKPGSTVVCYPALSMEALPVIMERCAQTGSRMVMGMISQMQVLERSLQGTVVSYRGLTFRIPLLGNHQLCNCVNAVETAFVLAEKGFAISEDQIVEGIEGARIPARAEVLSQKPLVLLDGAHNQSGAEALAELLMSLENKNLVGIIGMLQDKDFERSAARIAACCKAIIAVEPPGPRALSKEQMAGTVGKSCPQVETAENLQEACRRGLELAGTEGGLVVCGSLYLASQFRQVFLQENGRNLQ